MVTESLSHSRLVTSGDQVAAWLASTAGVGTLAGGVLALVLITAIFAYVADLAHAGIKGL